VAILGAWLLLTLIFIRSDERARAARLMLLASSIALAFVLLFQDPRMYRYGSQVLALVFLAALGLGGAAVASRRTGRVPARVVVAAVAVLILAAGGAVVWASATGLLQQLMTDVGRLRADPTRMAVLEARPLFMYTGVWDWSQPWVFFRSGFYIGLAGLALLTLRVARERRSIDLLIWITTACMFAATYGQNRFGYYLVPMCALLGGWLGSLAIEWALETPDRAARSRLSRRLRLAVALIAVAGMFATAVAPDHLLSTGAGSLPAYWRDALLWMREHSDPPFAREAGGDDYYYARYPDVSPLPDYTVMNWWDHGYWTLQIARRVPVANPTQERAPNSARFYAATNERDALAILRAERSRYVISDWELPFRVTEGGRIMGRFENVIDWAGGRHADYYEVMYRRTAGGWVPVWVFFEPYYRSMAYRLSVLGGAAARPGPNTTWVIAIEERVDSRGFRFKEILSQTPYPTYDAAAAAATHTRKDGRLLIVGLDPWQTAFPLAEVAHLREVYAARTPQQRASEAPYVRIFEVVP
jgi:asparagine N-glycosylation enzyme membrane subunit Stt3